MAFHFGQPSPSSESYNPSSVQFSIDEGFSEAFSSQDTYDDQTPTYNPQLFQDWVMSQNEEQRSMIAYEILQTLRTSHIASVVKRLTPRLYMDPVQRLPPEIIAEVFSNLDAHNLLTASLASRSWREKALDLRLWKFLYEGEGWRYDQNQVNAVDSLAISAPVRSKGKGRPLLRSVVSSDYAKPQQKKRATSDWLVNKEQALPSSDGSRWRVQHEPVEADTEELAAGEDAEMQDAPPVETLSPKRPHKRHSQDSGDEMELFSPQRPTKAAQTAAKGMLRTLQPAIKPSLTQPDDTPDGRLNWQYLYKQRRRLEENWTKGRFTNFQLPHPQFSHEAHTECVYTIQFDGKWLVSGSRDKSVRVWDLETKRLRGVPLWGHTQSVLCLQFDHSEDQDVIISGSSDTGFIVWRFSTGEKLYEVPQAHSESVLNLRFDHRFLVTCSKDKVIKVWNRFEMLPTDPIYPRKTESSSMTLGPNVIDVAKYTPKKIEEMIRLGQVKPLKPYSLLMTLRGHEAAVNAIQIDGDHIVSASGDRHVKLWNIVDGSIVRTFVGHDKGIACVQYDNRRIVSGSSDTTVRIYDPHTGAEVASLQGHQNLVRTVQAAFGDAPGNESELFAQARAAEHAYVEAVRDGQIALPEDRPRSRRREAARVQAQRNAGVNGQVADGTDDQPQTRPRVKTISFGANLPPGGGGSKWGRIVSGSYDETIIIWRKDWDGEWVVGQRLRHEAAVRAINQEVNGANNIRPATAPNPTVNPRMATAALNGAVNMPLVPASQIAQQAIATSMGGLATGVQNVLNTAAVLNRPWNAPPAPGIANGSSATTQNGWLTPGAQQAMHQLNAHAQNVLQAQLQQAQSQAGPSATASQQVATRNGNASSINGNASSSSSSAPAHQATTTTTTTTTTAGATGQITQPPTITSTTTRQPHAITTTNTVTPPPTTAATAAAANPVAPPAVITQPPHPPHPVPLNPAHPVIHLHPHGPHAGHPHPHINPQPTNRVFKLQFDARRIICCSQDSKIVAWDFANGDPEIEEAARFFDGIW